jgi:hypothetical protein
MPGSVRPPRIWLPFQAHWKEGMRYLPSSASLPHIKEVHARTAGGTRQMRHRKPFRDFILIELLVIVAIVAIATAILLPLYLRAYDGLALRSMITPAEAREWLNTGVQTCAAAATIAAVYLAYLSLASSQKGRRRTGPDARGERAAATRRRPRYR